jgi:aminocarboxymuconate-semialdehyde decarboxylase
MRIDCDTHYWPVEFLEKVDHPSKGRIESENGTVKFYRNGELVHQFSPTRWDLNLRKSEMDQEGFDIQVLIPDNRPFLYELDRDLGRAMAVAYNNYVAQAIRNEPRFIGVAWVYLPDMPSAVLEIRRCVEELGLRAVKLTGGYSDCDLDHESMWPLYEIAAHYSIPILVHPAARSFEKEIGHPWLIGSDRFQGMRFLPSLLGFPFTYIHSITRLIYSGVLDRFPKLKFAFFEGGAGWVPFLQNHLDRHLSHRPIQEFLRKNHPLERKPSEYFDRFYIAAVAWEPYLADVVKRWRNHNVIIGSDFDHGDAIATWPHTIEQLNETDELSDDEKKRILETNPMRLFNLADD